MLTGNTGQTLTSIINTMTEVVTLAVPWALLFMLFYWNIYKLVFESDNAEKRKQALPRLMWSIIAVAIVFSLGGLVNLLSNTLLGGTGSTFTPSGSSAPSGIFSPGSSVPGGSQGTTPSPTTPTPTSPSTPGGSPRPSGDPFNPGNFTPI